MRLVHELLLQQLWKLQKTGTEWVTSRQLHDSMWRRHPGTELGQLVEQGYVERRPTRVVQKRGPFAGTEIGGAVNQAYEYRLTPKGTEWNEDRDRARRPPPADV